jgi:hypothetical protein
MAISASVLRTIADAAHLPLADPSPASILAGFSVDLNTYVASRQWKNHGSEPNWHRRDFDAKGLRFGASRTTDTAYRLSEYIHPSLAHRREHFLIDGNRAATVDRDWGRYAVLGSMCRQVLRYDEDVSVLMVPVGTPLPAIFARALALCSGYAPSQVDVSGAGLVEAFVQVPRSIAMLVAKKLSQVLIPTRLDKLPRGLHD